MTTPRRDFLNWLGTSGALAAMPALPGMTPPTPYHPVTDKWDMSWCDRVNGKVRAVFDSPEISSGAALFRAQAWRDEHKEVYNTPPAEASAVVVFRHAGIPLVMNDAYWARFEVGKGEKVRDSRGKKWAQTNPIASSAPGTPPEWANYNVPAFIASGGIVLGCSLAFEDVIGHFKRGDKLSSADARQRALEHLIPGVILQPSGGFAVLRAQQAGCGYLFAS